ncbi:DUF6314 family protein [Streptomyces sp. NPDC048436]|uniref:DUF6314 family protein n=1 Tax=Streptomyces sp. NPDC048436 TaxID=3365550 RepID=UPI003723A1A5
MPFPDEPAQADDGRRAVYHGVPDVLAYLAGAWKVERTARDLAGNAEGHFSGTTVFTWLDAGEGEGSPDQQTGTPTAALLHHESGTFTWQGTPRPAERTLRYLPGDDPATARVRFADGRPFHDLDLRTGHHHADHPCALDLYRGEFEVFDADHWRTRWRVAGPAKDLILTTDYVRAAPA